MKLLSHLACSNLQWYPEVGIGYYPVKDNPYDETYFEKYVKMEDTQMGRELNDARIIFVNYILYYHSTPLENDIIDIGIGSGIFTKTMANCKGYDINPTAIDWLKKEGLFRSPYKDAFSNVTFWDSLEHIHKPSALLANVQNIAFVSCPIYRDCEHILSSKHFRKDEHCWYWTHKGLINFMHSFGFDYIEHNDMESKIGREDIGTYAFKKRL